MSLKKLAKLIREINKSHGFTWDIPKDVPTLLCLIHSEVSEALERFRDDKPIDEELADIIIRTLDLAELLGIDMDDVMARVIERNRNRPWKHGRKRF